MTDNKKLVDFLMSKGNTIVEIMQWIDDEIKKLEKEIEQECIDSQEKN